MAGEGLVRGEANRILDFIIRYELLLLAVAVPVLVLPRSYLWRWQQGLNAYAPLGDEAAPGLSPLTWVALGLVALPWLLRLVRQGRLSQRTPLDWPIALTLLTAAVGLWPSVDPLFSLERFLGLVAGVALYYGLVNSINTERRLRRLLALFLAGGAALALLGFAQIGWTTVSSPVAAVLAPVYRALAGLPKLGPKRFNDHVLASTLIIFVPLALCLLLAPVRRRYKPFLALLALLAGSYAVLSWSRGDLLALALTLLLLPAFVSRRWRILLLAIAVLALLSFVILLTCQPANLMTFDSLSHLHPSRWQVWTRALLMIRDYPFTGIGLDTFRIIAQNEYTYFNWAFDQSEHAHNLFLQAGVDQGLLGLIAFLWLIIAFYRVAWSTIRYPYAISSLGLTAGFTAFLIGGLFDNGVMSGPRAALVVWALLGLQVANCRLQIANRQSPIANRQSPITPHASRLTPHAIRLTPHATRITRIGRCRPVSRGGVPGLSHRGQRLVRQPGVRGAGARLAVAGSK
jgi:O-antigen ligase